MPGPTLFTTWDISRGYGTSPLLEREHALLDHEGLQIASDEADQGQVRLFILRSA